jgi:hypothetical protein
MRIPLVTLLMTAFVTAACSDDTINVGSRRQLFVDDFIVENIQKYRTPVIPEAAGLQRSGSGTASRKHLLLI